MNDRIINIPIEIALGRSIEDALHHSAVFAIRNQVSVSFVFNGLRIRVYPDSDLEKLKERYLKHLSDL